jgi:lysine-N-methylase
MQNNRLEYLLPSYFDKFICTGSDCMDNCCYGWNINIDKSTYKKYRKIKNKDLNKKKK